MFLTFIRLSCSRSGLAEASRLQLSAMRFYTRANRRTVHGLAAVVIMLWWGGLNCLIGCAVPAAEVDAVASHCSVSAESDCCHSQAGGEDLPSSATVASQSTRETLACCSLEAYSAEVKREARGLGGPAITLPQWNRVNFAFESDPRPQLPDRWAHLPDRGGTRLLFCVFLI